MDASAGHGLRQGMATMGWKRPVRGFWYKTKPMGWVTGEKGSNTPSAFCAIRSRPTCRLAPYVEGRCLWYGERSGEGRGSAWDETRWAVAAVAVVASLFSFAFSALAFPGKARWPIKTSVPEGADLDHPSRADLGDLIDADKLPDAPGVTKNDARFQDALIPKFDNPLGVTEGNILSTVGWLHLVAAEGDGDYHIQIGPAHDDHHGTDLLT